MTAVSSARENYGAIIVGGGVGGLVAACYLARAGARVLLLEASPRFGGLADTASFGEGFSAPVAAHAMHALDPMVVRDLGLTWRGLRYVQRDMKTIALRPGGHHITLPRSLWCGRAALAALPAKDAENYLRFRRALAGLARRLRPLWEARIDYTLGVGETPLAVFAWHLNLSDREIQRLEAFLPMSAAAYLDRWFENDALKAALGFDAALGGLSPQEAGSALMLVWRAAQGGFWRRGATAQVKGGPGALAAALEKCARAAGVELRSSARVERILVEGGRAQGAMLDTSEVFRARAVLSGLDARRTLLELVPPDGIGFGAAASLPEAAKIGFAKVVLALGAPPPFAGLSADDLRGRLIMADRPESAAEVKGASLTGELAANLVMEAVVPTASDSSLGPKGAHLLSVLLPLLPVAPKDGWETACAILLKRTLAVLEGFAPGLKDRVLHAEVFSPADIVRIYGSSVPGMADASRLMLPYEQRVRTRLHGLYLCGAGAEPVDAISGRAGRIAAAMVLAEQAGGTP